MLTSLFTAIVGTSIISLSFLLFGIKPIFEIVFAVFLITFSMYSFNKLTDREEDLINMPKRASFIGAEGSFLIFFSLIPYGAALLIGGLENKLAMPILLFPLCAGIAYSVKIPYLVRLKDILVMKNLIVSLSWALGAGLLPAIYLHNPMLVFLIFCFFLIKCFINTVLFDVRDIRGDGEKDVKTIPVIIGIDKTKKLLLVLNSLLIPWLAVSIYLGLFTKYIPILIFCIGYGYWYIIHFCKERAGKFSYDLVIDGEWILLVFLCFIVRSIHF